MRIDTAEEKQAEGRTSARWLGNYFTTDDKNLKNEEKDGKNGGEREKEGGGTSGKNGEMARKEMKMKRARWPARYKKDDERKGLIPRNVI